MFVLRHCDWFIFLSACDSCNWLVSLDRKQRNHEGNRQNGLRRRCLSFTSSILNASICSKIQPWHTHKLWRILSSVRWPWYLYFSPSMLLCWKCEFKPWWLNCEITLCKYNYALVGAKICPIHTKA